MVTANGEVPTKEEATVYVRELDLFVTVMLLEDTSAKITGTLTFGPVVRNHISSKMAGRSIATHQTAYHSLSLVYRQVLQLHLHVLLLHLHYRKAWPARSIQHQQEARILVMEYEETRHVDQQKPEHPNKNDNEGVRRDPLRDLPEWLEEFKEHLVDDSVPEHRDDSSSTHELPSEPRAKVVSGKHSILTLPEGPKLQYLPENQDYKGFLRKTHWSSRT